MGKRVWRIWIGSALCAAGAIVLAWCGWLWHESSEAQSRARQWLERSPASHAPVPPSAPPAFHRGDVVGELRIPRLGLSVMVLEGDDAGILKLGAGHIPGTGLPQSNGN